MHYHRPVLQSWHFQPIHIINNTQQSIVLGKYNLRYSVLSIRVMHCKKGFRRDTPRLQD